MILPNTKPEGGNFIRVHGNLESLKSSIIEDVEALYDLEFRKGDFLPAELALRMASVSERMNRELAVYIDRKGKIINISIGDAHTVKLRDVEGKRGDFRLSGVRCIHTHPNGSGKLSGPDISAMIDLKLDAMIALGVLEGNVTEVYAALPGQPGRAEIFGPYEFNDTELDILFQTVFEMDKIFGPGLYENVEDKERAILVGVETSTGVTTGGETPGKRFLDELEELAFTAGATVVHKLLQKKSAIDSAYYIGKGKAEELGLLRQTRDANLIIFDDELSGAQVRNIEDITGAKVIDRTTLILDIFAKRAKSKEGKLQVELAQLRYRLPRLIGLGDVLSRLGGGIGTRGPGEKKLEVDRRHIRRRISILESELKGLKLRRGNMRAGRRKNDIPIIALVGYTNVGKSTLMNKLCNTDLFAENKLFATLDPTTRKLTLPDGRDALLVDTVGFIRKLPHDLIEAFKSTLEEAVYADLLIHVADASSNEAETQIQVVDEILGNLGALNKDIVLVLNKIDIGKGDFRGITTDSFVKNFEVSAVTGQGLDGLLEGIGSILAEDTLEVHLMVPYDEGWAISYIHQNGKVLKEDYKGAGTEIKAVVGKSNFERLRKFIVSC